MGKTGKNVLIDIMACAMLLKFFNLLFSWHPNTAESYLLKLMVSWSLSLCGYVKKSGSKQAANVN